MRVLCLNAGSSGLRVACFEVSPDELRIVTLGRVRVEYGAWRDGVPAEFVPEAIVHRIVRGVKTGVPAEEYSESVRAEIVSLEDLAPTHDPQALRLLDKTRDAFPQARQFVAYDTAFHATIPAEHATYAIPRAWRELGIRRIGYHGLSCAYAALWLREHAAPTRAVCAHLGNGCSVTGLLDGCSRATTMGFTPLEGVVMGTRSGSVDPGALIFLQARGVSADELRETLYRDSGLRALCGTNDMREVEQRLAAGDADADLAFRVFTYSVASAIAQTAAAIGGMDALTFAGGIGLHSAAVRAGVCEALGFLGVSIDANANAGVEDTQAVHAGDSRVAVYALDVEEERMMALALSRALVTGR